MTQLDRKRMRELTMGCWWPSRAYPKPYPNWRGIADELNYLAYTEEALRNNYKRADEARRLAKIAQAATK